MGFGSGKKKTFSDSEIVKDCFLASAEILFAEFDNKDAIIKQIKGLQLSDSTIMRRIENIGKDVSVDVSVQMYQQHRVSASRWMKAPI